MFFWSAIAQEIKRTVTFAQAFSFCLFSLLYIPYLTTIGNIWRESKSFRLFNPY
ncbi:MAG: hypothetical protein VKJ02_10825 [Snowella sp.]|nr:hypothetical protein [Snowella sp.]